MRAIHLLLLSSLLLLPKTARAYCLTTTVNEPTDYEPTLSGCWKQGITLAWPAAPIGLRVDARASRKVSLEVAERTVVESFAKWSSVTCEAPGALTTADPAPRPAFEVRDLGPTMVDVSDCSTSECVRDRLAESGSILFRDSGWPTADGPETYALTTLTYRPSTGRVYGAFMELNTADHDFVEHGPAPDHAAALDYVITHEAGHFLGLAHSDKSDSIMFSRYRNDGDATLRADDRAAICAIRAAPDEPEAKGCACGVPRATETSEGALSTVVALLFWSRRRRTKRRRAPS